MKQDVASKDEVIEYTQQGVDDAFEEIEKTLKARTTSSNVKSRMVTSFVNSQLGHENPMYESRYSYVRSEGRTAQTAAGQFKRNDPRLCHPVILVVKVDPILSSTKDLNLL